MVMVAMVSGCATHNETRLDEEGVVSRTSTANTARITPEGEIQATTQGVGATVSNKDLNGDYIIIPGASSSLSAIIPNMEPNGEPIVMRLFSPKDMEMATFEFTPQPLPGQPAMKITGLKANISEPLKQYVAALQVALPILSEMTKAEAEAKVEEWRIAGTFGADVISLLKDFLPLLFPVTAVVP